MNRTEKEKVVNLLADRFARAAAVFLTEYRGLKVSEMTELRRELSKVRGELRVVKNRLAKRALEQNDVAKLEGFRTQLTGPVALAFAGEDLVAVAKILAKYQEEFEALKIRSGILRGEVIGAKEVEKLSKLPSKEELYAKLLGTLLAPASNLVRVLQGTSEKLARVLAAVRDGKQAS